jgi:hypothetical protein
VLLVAVVVGCLVAVVQSSVFEWVFHRYWLHRPWPPKDCFTSHTLVHHQVCKFHDTFHVVEEEQREALSFEWWAGPALIVINVVPCLLSAWGLAALGVALPYVPFLVSFATTLALYYVGYESLHYLMHKSGLPLVEGIPYFRFIERHHRIHHIHMDRNLNVLLPIADFVLGTLVTEMPAPTATPEAARRLARRHSRFGARMRAGAE